MDKWTHAVQTPCSSSQLYIENPKDSIKKTVGTNKQIQ